MTKFEQNAMEVITVSVTTPDSFSATGIASLFVKELVRAYTEERSVVLREQTAIVRDDMERLKGEIKQWEDRATAFRIQRRWMAVDPDAMPPELQRLENEVRRCRGELDSRQKHYQDLAVESAKAPPTFDNVLPRPSDARISSGEWTLWQLAAGSGLGGLVVGIFVIFILEAIPKWAEGFRLRKAKEDQR